MKTILTAIFVTLLLTACGGGPDKSGKRDTVYLAKPKINDSTVLKAHLEVRMWAAVFQTISRQAQKIGTPLDTAQVRKAKDSIYMSINTLSKAINDSAVNKPYF